MILGGLTLPPTRTGPVAFAAGLAGSGAASVGAAIDPNAPSTEGASPASSEGAAPTSVLCFEEVTGRALSAPKVLGNELDDAGCSGALGCGASVSTDEALLDRATDTDEDARDLEIGSLGTGASLTAGGLAVAGGCSIGAVTLPTLGFAGSAAAVVLLLLFENCVDVAPTELAADFADRVL